MPCIGFTIEADTDFRRVSIDEKIEFKRLGAAKCAGCKGVRGKSDNELKVNRWTAKYRCKRPGDTGNFCSFGCVLLLITEIIKDKHS